MKELNYIAELVLPSRSAYSIQVMKMCNAFSELGYKTNLHVLNSQSNKIHKIYNCNSNFKIYSHNLKINNFISRLLFATKLVLKNKNLSGVLYSRSIITGIFLSFFKKDVVIEIHHELKGFTFFLFQLCKNFDFFKKIKFVFITKNLKKNFNLSNKSVIADDGVDLNSFKLKKNKNKYKNTCVYTGSFAKGKGLEKIIKISKLLPKIEFHLYGDFSNSTYSNETIRNYNNIKYFGFSEYKNMPKILNKYDLYLMPYENKVYVRSKNIEVSKFMSPMKLFEYMAADGVLIASDLSVYNHILNKKNSILIRNNSINLWKRKIEEFFKIKKKFLYLSKNAHESVKLYTWDNRAKKIVGFINV